MSQRKAKPLAALEAKARQLMLMVGFGFVAYTGGTILSVMLMNRLNHRLVAADSRVLYLLAVIFVGQLWILFVLPALLHLACRFLQLPIWRTAIIAAVTGTAFNAAIRFVSSGIEQTFSDPLQNVVWGGSVVAGVFFSVWAGKQGQAWADQRQRLADQAALARKSQYDQFLADSTALADRREAAQAAAGGPAAPSVLGGSDPAPVAPVPGAPIAATVDPVPPASAVARVAPIDGVPIGALVDPVPPVAPLAGAAPVAPGADAPIAAVPQGAPIAVAAPEPTATDPKPPA